MIKGPTETVKSIVQPNERRLITRTSATATAMPAAADVKPFPPGFRIEEIKADGFPPLRREHKQGVTVLELANTRLEARFGKVIPDVVTDATNHGGQTSSPLLIEVTVTNHIDVERQDRIESLGIAALEIDFSLAGGQITRRCKARSAPDRTMPARLICRARPQAASAAKPASAVPADRCGARRSARGLPRPWHRRPTSPARPLA